VKNIHFRVDKPRYIAYIDRVSNGDLDMTTFTYSEELFSDFHKDAYGFRPRGHEFYDAETTPERKQEIWDAVGEAFVRAQQEQEMAETVAQAEFEAQVSMTMALGAGTRETAIRWILSAETNHIHDLMYGASYFEWKFGLKFGSYTEEFTPIIRELEAQYEEMEAA